MLRVRQVRQDQPVLQGQQGRQGERVWRVQLDRQVRRARQAQPAQLGLQERKALREQLVRPALMAQLVLRA